MGHTHTTHTQHTLSAGHAASLLYPHLSLSCSCSTSLSLFETRKFCAIKIFVQLFFGLAARVGVMGLCNNFYLKCVGERERATERERERGRERGTPTATTLERELELEPA